MRILQVTPTFFSDSSVVGGGERYIHNVCAAVATAARGMPVRSDMLSFAPNRAIVPIGPMTDLHLIPGSPNNLISCAGDTLDEFIDAYDVIHVHQCLLPWGVFIAARARVAGKIVIGTDHGGGQTPHLEAYPLLGGMFHAFHAQSNFAATAFLQLATPVRVILGPVDKSLFHLSRVPRDRSLFVALGRILPHKGYEHAIDALPEGATLTIIGRRYDEAYLAFLQSRATGKDVRFEYNLDDNAVAALLRRAGLYLHTGTHVGYMGDFYAKPELLALAPLEAMCAGTPAIVSRAGALPELRRLAGCRSYADDAELAILMRTHLDGDLFNLASEDIRLDVIRCYGLAQFGTDYLRLIAEIGVGSVL